MCRIPSGALTLDRDRPGYKRRSVPGDLAMGPSRSGNGHTLERGGPGRGLHASGISYPWIETISGMIRIATMFAILIIGLIAGPAVSLYGSPTVSPVTDAAWASEPLPP